MQRDGWNKLLTSVVGCCLALAAFACAPVDDGVLFVDAAQSVAEQEAWVEAAHRINEASGVELLRLEIAPCEMRSRGCLSTVDQLENAWGLANYRLRYGVASREAEFYGGVYLHELGHLLGLEHTERESAMHSPSFDCWGRWEIEQLGLEGAGECERPESVDDEDEGPPPTEAAPTDDASSATSRPARAPTHHHRAVGCAEHGR